MSELVAAEGAALRDKSYADGSRISERERVKHGPAREVLPAQEGDFVLECDLVLECGRVLTRPTLHYAIYGRLNAGGDNAVLVCHALSGSALVGQWWPGLFWESANDDNLDTGSIVDLGSDAAICINLLGSCYGSTGPGSVDAGTGQVYGANFPLISIRDNVRAQAKLLDWLGVRFLKMAIGGSIGGMQALEWSILFPERIRRAVVIGVAPLNAMGLALNHIQRRAIVSDPAWLCGRYVPGARLAGLALAREMAVLSYKSAALLAERFGREPNRNGEYPWALDGEGGGLGGTLTEGRFDVAGFLDYQGARFVERFDANAYLAIMRTMDTWDPGRGFASIREAFSRIKAEVTFLGIGSDWLFPAEDVRKLADEARDAGVDVEYLEMPTAHGHDGFLAEQTTLVGLLRQRI